MTDLLKIDDNFIEKYANFKDGCNNFWDKCKERMNTTERAFFARLKRCVSYDKDKNVLYLQLKRNKETYGNVVMQTNLDCTPEEVLNDALFILSEVCGSKIGKLCEVRSSLVSECADFIEFGSFKPKNMIEIERHSLGRITSPLQSPPASIPEVLLGVLATDGLYKVNKVSIPSVFMANVGSRDGLPLAIVTNVHNAHVKDNLEKMSRNALEPKDVVQKDMIAATMMLLKSYGWTPDITIECEQPDWDLVREHLKKYNSAGGITPFYEAVTLQIIKAKAEDGYITVNSKYVKRPPKKKKDMADEVVELTRKYLDRVWDEAEKHKVCDRIFPGESINVSAMKYEILNGLTGAKCFEELKKMHNKCRIFFIEAVHFIIVSMIFASPIFNYVNINGVEIGTKLNKGGQARIYKRMDCGSTIPGDPIFETLYTMFPFLREREYFGGDFSGFDMTLLYRLLNAVGMFIAFFYSYRGMNGYAARTVMSDIIYRLTFKYLYITFMSRLYKVEGMMFSGKYETSNGNTLYQCIVFFMYLDHKLRQYKDNKNLVYLKIGIKYHLFCFAFSGDDNFLGYPKVFSDWFNINAEDYKEFVKEKAGLIYKYIEKAPLYGVVYCEEVLPEFWVEIKEKTVKGMTFLKNSCVHVYERSYGSTVFEYQGILTYRDWDEVVFRLGNSDKSNQYTVTVFAKIMSLANLCIGNRMAFAYLRHLYRTLKSVMQFNDVIRVGDIKHMARKSGAVYYLIQGKDDDDYIEFPKIEDLRDAHNAFVNYDNKRSMLTFNTLYGMGYKNRDNVVIERI